MSLFALLDQIQDPLLTLLPPYLPMTCSDKLGLDARAELVFHFVL